MASDFVILGRIALEGSTSAAALEAQLGRGGLAGAAAEADTALSGAERSATRAGVAAESAAARNLTFAQRMEGVNAASVKLHGSMTSLFAGAGIFAAGALTIGAATKGAMDFNKAMTLIQTQAGGTAADVKYLSAAVLDLGKQSEHGPQELAAGLYHLKSVAMDNADAMKALKAAEEGASVGGASLEDTTNAIAGAWKSGIKGASDFEQTMATVNSIVGAGNMRLADLVAALGTGILDSAKTAGLSLTDVGSALAVMTSHGMPAEAAATRLRMAFSMMAAPTDAAAKVMGVLGMKSTDLAVAMRHGGLIEALQVLKDHISSLSKVDQQAALSKMFGGGRSSAGLLSLLNGLDQVRKAQDQIVGKADEFGAAVTAEKATPAAKWEHIKAVLASVGTQFGEAILPAVSAVLDKLAVVIEFFDRLPTPIKLATIGFVSFGAVLLGLGVIFGALIPVATAFSLSLAGILLPILAIGAGIAAAIAVGYLLATHWEQVKAVAEKVWSAIKTAVGAAIDFIKGVATTMLQQFVGFWTTSWNAVKTAAEAVWNALVAAFRVWAQLVVTVTMGPILLLVTFLREHWQAIATDARAVWDAIVNFFRGVWNTIVGVVRWGLQEEWNLVLAGLNLLRDLWSRAWNGLLDALHSVWSGIVSVVSGWVSFFTKLGSDIMHGLWDGITGWATKLWDGVKDVATGIKNAFANVLGLHSPSTVFRGFGVDTLKGFDLGVADGMSPAVETMQTAATAVSAPFEAMPAHFATLGQQTAANFTAGFYAGLPDPATLAAHVTSQSLGVLSNSGFGPVSAHGGLSAPGAGKAGTGSQIMAWAVQTTAGVPYSNTREDLKGLDCSGLVQYVYRHFGVNLPRTASQQAKYGRSVGKDPKNWQPGDLLFFYYKDSPWAGYYPNHVALYLGGGQVWEESGHGTTAHKAGVDWSALVEVRRVIPDQKGGGSSLPTGSLAGLLAPTKKPGASTSGKKTGGSAATASVPATTAIKDLLSFVTDIADQLRELAKSEKVKLPEGWRKTITSIVTEAATVANVVAKALDDALGSSKDRKRLARAEQLTQPVQDLIDFVTTVDDSLKTLQEASATKLKGGWKGTVKSIVGEAIDVSKLVSTLLNDAFGKKAATKLTTAAGLTSPVETLVSFVNTVTADLASLSGGTVPKLRTTWEADVTAVVNAAVGVARTAADALKTAASSATVKALTNATTAASPIQSLLEFVNSVTGTLTTLATATLPSLSPTWQKDVYTIVQRVMDVAYIAATALRNASDDAAVKWLTTAVNAAGPVGSLMDFVNSVSGTLKTLAETTVGTLGPAWQAQVYRVINTVLDIAYIAATALKNASGDEAVKWLSAAVTATTPVGALLDFVNSITTALGTLSAATITTLAPEWQDSIGTLIDQVIALASFAADKLNAAYTTDAVKALSAAVSASSPISGLLDFVNNVSKTMGDIAAFNINSLDAAKANLTAILDAVGEAVGMIQQKVITISISTEVQTIINDVQTLFAQLRGLFTESVQGTTTSMSALVGQWKGAWDTMMADAFAAVKELYAGIIVLDEQIVAAFGLTATNIEDQLANLLGDWTATWNQMVAVAMADWALIAPALQGATAFAPPGSSGATVNQTYLAVQPSTTETNMLNAMVARAT